MQNPTLGKEEPLQQYRLGLMGRGAALQKRIWVSGQRASWAWARSVPWQQKKPKAEQPGGWQMCLSSFPRLGWHWSTKPSFGSPMQEKHGHTGATSADTTKRFEGKSPLRRGWGNWTCLASEEMALKETTNSLTPSTRKLSTKWSQAFQHRAWWEDERQ